jgi:uncharacterized protein YcaQ
VTPSATVAEVPDLSWSDVAAWRSRRHRLHERAPATAMLQVAGELCGVHAQVMSSAELTLHARVDDLESTAVADALWRDRTLVKTWAMRGTLHLLPAVEYPLWQAALSTQYARFTKPAWSTASGIQPDELERLIDAVAEALGGDPLTREELADAVARRSGDATLGLKLRESWGAFLKPAAVRGVLCFAPGDGQRVRFTRPDRWLGEQPRPDPADAEPEAARRYLAVHGPATREDLGRWWGAQPAPAGRLLRRLGDAVTEVTVEGAPMWMLTADAAEAARGVDRCRSVRLLPGFDQYVIAATRHAEHLTVPGDFRASIYRRQGWISAVVVVDGRIDGVWRLDRKGRRLVVEVVPLAAKPARGLRTAVEEEAERIAAWLGGELALRWTLPG